MSANLGVTISLSPTSGTSTTPAFSIEIVFSYTGPNPSGTLQILVDGTFAGTVEMNGGAPLSPGVGLNNPSTPGVYQVQVSYSGDSNFAPTVSNIVPFTVTGDVPVVVAGLQAVARPTYQATVSGDRTRTQIENGEETTVTYLVSGIVLLSVGSGYDSNSVATLTGNGVRQNLTIVRGNNGSITALTGFDISTAWPSPPKVTITRWTSAGVYVPG